MDKLTTKYTPVNKGHFELDTEERIASFRAKMAIGWGSGEYELYRREWEENPKKKIIRDYPPQVDIELSSACNLNCPMCYTTTEQFKKSVEKVFMDFKLYKNIVNEVAGKIHALRLSWRGEPTLYPGFVEAVRYAKSRGIREISFLTNASKLDMDYFVQLAEAGADWISVSVDGMGETYNEIRKPLIFEETVQKLAAIHEYKDKRGISKPVIKIQTIWPAIRNNPEKFYNTFAPISDLVAFNPLIDYLGKDEDIVYEQNFYCPQHYERLFIASNGLVHMCNSDEFGELPVGDARQETIHEIWHGEKLNSMRRLHGEVEGFMRLKICRKCFYPRKTEKNERAVVNAREVCIENYINRKQKIGE